MELPAKCEGTFDEAIGCRVIFDVNYLTKEVHVALFGGYDLKRNMELDLVVQNKFDEPKTIDANAKYNCQTKDDCAKVFYHSTIQTLIHNELILHQLRAELFDPGAVTVQQCSNKQDQPIVCQNAYGCHGWEMIEENNKIIYGAECRNASTETTFPQPYFRITLIQGDPLNSSDWNHLGFTCNKQNMCNSRQHIKKMVNLANDFYPWKLLRIDSSAKSLIAYHSLLLLLAMMLAVYICFPIS